MKFPRFNHFLMTFITLMGLTVGMFLNNSTAHAAFGTSPPWVKNDHLLPGTTYEQIVNLSRSNTDTEMQATIRLAGDKNLIKWIEISNKDNLIMRKGQNSLPMKVIINIPKRAAIKDYVGSIFVTMLPVKNTGGQGGAVSINLGANIEVNISVIGEKVIDYQVKSVSTDTLWEGDPFSVNVEVENLGNTEISKPRGQIDIYKNTARTEILKSLDFIALSEPIPPDETKISKMVFEDIILDLGEYWIVPKTFKDGKLVSRNGLVLKVMPKAAPVAPPEAATAKKPALPGTAEKAEGTPPADQQVPDSDVRQAAPAAPVAPIVVSAPETNSVFLIFGLAGLGLGLVALIGIIVVLIMVLKNQRQDRIMPPNVTQNNNVAETKPNPDTNVENKTQ